MDRPNLSSNNSCVREGRFLLFGGYISFRSNIQTFWGEKNEEHYILEGLGLMLNPPTPHIRYVQYIMVYHKDKIQFWGALNPKP